MEVETDNLNLNTHKKVNSLALSFICQTRLTVVYVN